MSGCGGLFVFMAVASNHETRNMGRGLIMISVPSLLLGLVFVVLAIKGLVQAQRDVREGTEQESSVPMSVLVAVIGLIASVVGGFMLFGSLRKGLSGILVALSILLPGLAVLVVGLTGIGHATSARPKRVYTIGEIPGTGRDSADPATASDKEVQ
jgi:hypothetical protein